MSDARQMPKIKPDDYGRLDDIQKMYIRRVEKQNVLRAAQYTKVRSKKRTIGMLFGLFTLSVYFYSMFAIKQEKLGEEYDQRITDSPKTEESE